MGRGGEIMKSMADIMGRSREAMKGLAGEDDSRKVMELSGAIMEAWGEVLREGIDGEFVEG